MPDLDMKRLDDSFDYSVEGFDPASGPDSIPGFDSPGDFFRQRSGFLGTPSRFSIPHMSPQPLKAPAVAPTPRSRLDQTVAVFLGDEFDAEAAHRSFYRIPAASHWADGADGEPTAERTSAAVADERRGSDASAVRVDGPVVSFIAIPAGRSLRQHVALCGVGRMDAAAHLFVDAAIVRMPFFFFSLCPKHCFRVFAHTFLIGVAVQCRI